MTYHYFSKRRLVLYVVPIIIGLGGVIFSQQIASLWIRLFLVALSVAIPMFAILNLLARFNSSRVERLFLLIGVMMLFVGASFSVSGLSESFESLTLVPPFVVTVTRSLGAFSLLLGLFVVLYSVVRTGEDIVTMTERFRNLAEHISEGLVLSRNDGVIFLVNGQFLEMFGLRRNEVVGRNARDLAIELNAPRVEEHMEIRAQGTASEYEMTHLVGGDERRFWFHGTPIFDRRGVHTATLTTVRDITEHHRLSQQVEEYAEGLQELVENQTKQLLQSESRFRQLLLTMNEGFLTIDGHHRIRFANERIGKLLGRSAKKLLDQDVFEFLSGPGRIRLLNLLAQGAGIHRSESRHEVDFINDKGEMVPAVVAVAYIRETEEEEPVYSLVVTSVVELKEMQHQLEVRARELERANEELRMHDRAKDSFLSNVSHELRTPLSTIQGYVEMLMTGSLGDMEGTQLAAVRVMERNVNRLIGMINEMIEFSRMEIRGVKINFVLCSAAKLIRECAASVHPHAVAKNVTVNVFLPDDLPHLWADREKLGQVLGILLDNAVKFTDPGGMIQVRAEARPDRTLAIAVSDTGIGIGSSYQERVFDKFFQVDGSKTRRYEGTGIGLSIARGVAQAHRGHIDLESNAGQGSTFTVVLPESLLDSEPMQTGPAGMESLRVLIVDEGVEFFEGVRGALIAAGCAAKAAPNGFECIRAAEEMHPSLVVVNDSPADIAGMATIGLLRQNFSTQDLPILLCSGEDRSQLSQVSGMWREVAYLQRPFTVEHLYQRVLTACFGEPQRILDEKPEPGEDTISQPHVLVVDSDPGLLEWAKAALETKDVLCYCSHTPKKAIEAAANHRPDVIFLDMDSPGAEAQDHLAAFQRNPVTLGVPLYIMTGIPGSKDPRKGHEAILRKPFTLDEMARVIHRAKSLTQAHAPKSES